MRPVARNLPRAGAVAGALALAIAGCGGQDANTHRPASRAQSTAGSTSIVEEMTPNGLVRVRATAANVRRAPAVPYYAPTRRRKLGRITHTYRVTLTGGRSEIPNGAPHGNGLAIIAVHEQNALCWTLQALHGTDAPIGARLLQAPRGKTGAVLVWLGNGFQRHGCQPAIAAAAIHAIENHPTGYYVNVYSNRYPDGAMRGQL